MCAARRPRAAAHAAIATSAAIAVRRGRPRGRRHRRLAPLRRCQTYAAATAAAVAAELSPAVTMHATCETTCSAITGGGGLLQQRGRRRLRDGRGERGNTHPVCGASSAARLPRRGGWLPSCRPGICALGCSPTVGPARWGTAGGLASPRAVHLGRGPQWSCGCCVQRRGTLVVGAGIGPALRPHCQRRGAWPQGTC